MEKYRNTYVSVNLTSIQQNVSKIIARYNKYKYYIGVVKADSYGHYGIETVKMVIAGGCNYLAVSSLEEALIIREKIKDIPIICLGYIDEEYIFKCLKNNITITINSLEYLKNILNKNIEGLKIHLKIDTGMNRLGLKDESQIKEALNIIKQSKLNFEGIFTHIYNSENNDSTNSQLQKFSLLLTRCNLMDTKIIHVAASETIVKYSIPSYINGCRMGIIMYGFTKDKSLGLTSTFSLTSEIIEIKEIQKGETVGYGGIYKAEKKEKIGIVPIGYADGVIRKNTGRMVYINNKAYKIIGNICMDMLMVKIDDKVNLHDKVEILKDNNHIEQVAKYMDTIPYEILCSISKRVPRVYVK